MNDNTLLGDQDYFGDKLSEKASKIANKDIIEEDIVNKTNVVHNKTKNFYGLFSDEKESKEPKTNRNTVSGKELLNKSFISLGNNIVDTKIGNSVKPKILSNKDTKNNNIGFFLSKPGVNYKKSLNKENNKNINNINNASKISDVGNSFINDGRNNNKKLEHQHQKTEPNIFNIKYNNISSIISNNNKRGNKNNKNLNKSDDGTTTTKDFSKKNLSQPPEKSKKNEIFKRNCI